MWRIRKVGWLELDYFDNLYVKRGNVKQESAGEHTQVKGNPD